MSWIGGAGGSEKAGMSKQGNPSDPAKITLQSSWSQSPPHHLLLRIHPVSVSKTNNSLALPSALLAMNMIARGIGPRLGSVSW